MLVTKLEKVDCVVSGEKEIQVNNKGSEHFWNFTLFTKNKTILRNVALINDTHRHHFSLILVKHRGHFTGRDDTTIDPSQKIEDVQKTYDLESSPSQQQVS